MHTIGLFTVCCFIKKNTVLSISFSFIVDKPGSLFSHSGTIKEKNIGVKEEGTVRTHIKSHPVSSLIYFMTAFSPGGELRGIKVSHTQQEFGTTGLTKKTTLPSPLRLLHPPPPP